MFLSRFVQKVGLCFFAIVGTPSLVLSQGNFKAEAAEYDIGGNLPGDQVFPSLSLKPTGGYVVWQDNRTDGDGMGISARRLDGNFSGLLSSFRVNEAGAFDQMHPVVVSLNGGGAAFVWQGGKRGFQHIYARLLSSSNTWVTGDVLVNSTLNKNQNTPRAAALADGNVVVLWGSFNQESTNSMTGIYAQRLSPLGQKLGGEIQINQEIAFNQRSAVIAPLVGGGFVVAWVTEQQRFENSVDIFARIFNANGVATGNEFLVNSSTNICGNPAISPSSDGGFMVSWGERGYSFFAEGWDIYARRFAANGAAGVLWRVNEHQHGDQYAPSLAAAGEDYLAVWTSLGQDGSREGVYGRFLRGDGSPAGDEFRVNTGTFNQQLSPCVASDGDGRFLVAWSSFLGIGRGMDVLGQRYASINDPLAPPDPPFVTVISSNTLSVTWPVLAGFSVSNYEVYADGSPSPAVAVTSNRWNATGLAPSSTHSYRLAYVLADGRRSELSGATTNTTYGAQWFYDVIPAEWMTAYWGDKYWTWPSPDVDSDGDGASNREEFRAGTDPTDPSSVLAMHWEATSQGMFLKWNSRPGLIYQVERTTDFRSWTKFGGARFAAGTEDSLFVGQNNSGFYRLELLR